MVLTASQIASLQRVISQCNHALPRIELLAALAEVNPMLKGRVNDLKTQREYQVTMANTALEVDRQLGSKDAYRLHGGVGGVGRD